MTIAFVLSGGGSLGAVQVGMLQAFAERDVHPDLLIGTSAGAINAAYIAGHGTSRRALHDLAAIWPRSGGAYADRTSFPSTPSGTCSPSSGTAQRCARTATCAASSRPICPTATSGTRPSRSTSSPQICSAAARCSSPPATR